MRSVLFGLFALAACGVAQGADAVLTGPPVTLLDWLKLVPCEGYRLVFAAEHEGHFYALSSDQDGDLLFSSHCFDERARYASGGVRISDPASSADLFDPESKKTGPRESKTVRIRFDAVDGEAVEGEVAYPTGVLYPLKQPAAEKVRIEIYKQNNGKQEVLLQHVLKLSERVPQ